MRARIARSVLISLIFVAIPGIVSSQVVINEVVTDPEFDWSDSVGGNGVQFDHVPGIASPNLSDEWLELKNTSGTAVDVTGWTVTMADSSPDTEVLGGGTAVLVFSSGGSVAAFQSGEYLVIGNPYGAMDDVITIELRDALDGLIDAVVMGPGGAPDGQSDSPADEAIARSPDGTDTDVDADDFWIQRSTIGSTNGLFVDGFESGDSAHWSEHFP